jgi:hypothetical protein
VKYIFSILIFILLTSAVNAQNNNPFEIKNRLSQTKPTTENPFDVKPGNDTLARYNSNPQNNLIDSTSTLAIDLSENPFDVDHVPLRTSTLREESALKTIKRRNNKLLNQTKESGSGLLVFLIAIASLLLIAIVANTRRSIFTKIFKSFYNDNYLKLTQREENGGLNGAYIILYLIYFLNAGIFVWLAIKFFVPGSSPSWLLCILFVFGIYFSRHVLLFLFSEIFPVGREVKQYNFIIATFNLLLGLILVPLNLIIAYTSPSIGTVAVYSMLSIIVFVFFIRCAKGFLLGLIASGGALFNFLLYLCTFEIVPILILIKLGSELGSIL